MKRVLILLLFLMNGLLWGNSLRAFPVIKHPQVFKGNGSYHLLFEILVENPPGEPARRIAEVVLGGNNFRRQYGGEELKRMFGKNGSLKERRQEPFLNAGEVGAFYFLLSFNRVEEIPPVIYPVIQFASGQRQEIEPMEINFSPPVVLQPPVEGDYWFAANGPSNPYHHRRALFFKKESVWVPQRFAIDWIQFDENGKWFYGKNNQDYVCYGKPVLAVADGEIVQIEDGIPENRPGEKLGGSLMGNYVVLKVNEDTYATYAHLIPGSLRVHEGQRVRAGEVLGLIGNSGNSTGPHLHFQVTGRPEKRLVNDTINPMFASGKPFTLSHFMKQNYRVIKGEGNIPNRIEYGAEHPVSDESIMNKNLTHFRRE